MTRNNINSTNFYDGIIDDNIILYIFFLFILYTYNFYDVDDIFTK
jgi:hypothetical protein